MPFLQDLPPMPAICPRCSRFAPLPETRLRHPGCPFRAIGPPALNNFRHPWIHPSNTVFIKSSWKAKIPYIWKLLSYSFFAHSKLALRHDKPSIIAAQFCAFLVLLGDKMGIEKVPRLTIMVIFLQNLGTFVSSWFHIWLLCLGWSCSSGLTVLLIKNQHF